MVNFIMKIKYGTRGKTIEENLSSLEEIGYSNGNQSSHIVEVEIPKLEAGNKDPYRLCLNYMPINLAV